MLKSRDSALVVFTSSPTLKHLTPSGTQVRARQLQGEEGALEEHVFKRSPAGLI